jgi:hypothetical protein
VVTTSERSAAPRARRRSIDRAQSATLPLPPAHAALLGLQRTAGNRAVSSLLLRQPAPAQRTWLGDLFDPLAHFWEELKVRAEVEQDRARFEAQKQEHQRRLKEIEERERPHVLKSKGVSPTTRVDENTAALVQAALAESRILRPYIKAKFPAASIPGKVKIHDSEPEFEHAYVKLTKLKDSPSAVQAKAEKVRGFYHPKSGVIHLRPTSNLGHAIHEAMHKLAQPGFHGFFGDLWEEGVAQYFTDCLLVEHGLSPTKTHLYADELRCAKRLVAFVGSRDLVAQAYFLNHIPLLDMLRARLGGPTDDLRGQKLCDRLP